MGNLKAGVDIRNRFFSFFLLNSGKSKTTKTSIRKMFLAAFITGALLGSASLAQAGRKCITCLALGETDDCYPEDVSEFIPDAPNAANQFDPKIVTIKECADDEKCLYYTFKTTWGLQVGRFCANEAEHRNGIEEKRWKKTYGYKGLECYKGKQKGTRTCFKICDTDLCNASAYQKEAIELESETLLETKKTEKTKTKETKTKKTKTKKTKTKETKKTLLETLLETKIGLQEEAKN